MTTGAERMLGQMIGDRVAERTTTNYINSWRDACGAGPNCEPPLPITALRIPNENMVCFDGSKTDVRYAYGWCTTKDELGTWWSYRVIVLSQACIGDDFDMWEGHSQRQQAKARANANAMVQQLKWKEKA